MKKTLLMSALLLIVGISGSMALPQGYTGGVRDGDRSNYTAKYKTSHMAYVPGVGYTNITNFYTISAPTMATCQQELYYMASLPNVSVIQHCYSFDG
jgi:hypothetical protein